MSSTENDSKYLLCVRYADIRFGHKYYINYVSEPSEKRSLKLPQAMLEVSQQQEGQAESNAAKMDLEESILRYLIARYGKEMPAMYLTEDGRDLVMDFHIFEKHAGALKKLPSVDNVMRKFLNTVIMVFILRVQSILEVNSFEGWMQVPKFEIEEVKDRIKMAPGRRATIERILKAARVAPRADETAEQAEDRVRKDLIPSWPIKVGDRLFSLGWSDEHMQRTAFMNLVVSDHPNSLSLPPILVKIARSSTREAAHAMARNINMANESDIFNPIISNLISYHTSNEPQVFESADNAKHLVFEVPFNIKHAPMLIKCFTGEKTMINFYSGIFSALSHHFEYAPEHPRGMERALKNYIIGADKPKTTARKATKRHIHSVLFRERLMENARTPPENVHFLFEENIDLYEMLRRFCL